MTDKKLQRQEKEWLERLIEGDEEAFCELYAAYKKRLMYLALRMLKSPAYAEDIFQDTFSVIWNNRRSLDPTVPFGPYVYTIMRNRILNTLSRLDKEEHLKAELMEAALDGQNKSEDGIINTLVSREINEIMEAAIARLTPQQQKIFRMSREDYLSHQEIADHLHLSVNTVKLHISEALKTLRGLLGRYAENQADIILILFCLNLMN